MPCEHPPPPDPPNLWSRATLSCVNYDAYTSEQLAMRRKAEILNYKGNKNPLTKKQQWSRIVKGNGPLGKKVWATQNDLGSNPNVFNLQQVGNTLILCPNDDTEDKYFAYVANTLDGVSPNGNVFAYRINQTTGMLSFIGSFPTGISPSSMSVDPNGKFLYVTNADDNNVSGYMIDQTTGMLSSIGTFPTGNSPSRITVEPNGKFAYVVNYSGYTVSGYMIDQTTGMLSSIGTFPTGNSPIGITVEPNGKFLYVTNTGDANVSGYMIDQITGDLLVSTVNSPYTAGTNPVFVAVDPNGTFLYVTNSISSSVSGYMINQTTGELVSTLNSPYTAGTNPGPVTFDGPNGKFLYVTNTGDPNVSGYIIDQITGELLVSTVNSPYTTGLAPSSMAVDPNGKFLYVTNYGSDNVSGYMIDQTTGELVPTVNSPYNSISFPQSIITVRISAKKNTIKCAPSSASDVPGNSVLCYDPAVPLVNYLPPQRTFLAGGTKWPQSTWKPGDNGFPRGKKGSMNMLFQ